MNNTSITIITGLSGSGKSTAIAAFEDAGFYCVDNMPVALLPKFLELPFESDSGIAGLAFGMDLREKEFILTSASVFEKLREIGYKLEILFLESDEEILLRRFSQTRRHHPLAQGKSILDGIRDEKNQLTTLRESANYIINTSRMNIHELKSLIFKYIQKNIPIRTMRTHIMSFGFKFGIPHDADLIMDVRFLKNPYFVPELKNFDGETQGVKDFVLNSPETRIFIKKYLDLLDYLIPLYEKEGKAYLTIAFGCTGGKHRSVAIASEIYQYLNNKGTQVELTHRDKDN